MARPNKDKSRNQIAKEEAETELVTTQESKPLEKFSLDTPCPVQNAVGPVIKKVKSGEAVGEILGRMYISPVPGVYEVSPDKIVLLSGYELPKEEAVKYAPSKGGLVEAGIIADHVHRMNNLPPCSEDYVRNMFPHPQCKVAHAYGIMKVSYLLKELALELYYCCPHNEHLRVALGELEDAYEGCIKAVKSVE
jgi:hypothetical protein